MLEKLSTTQSPHPVKIIVAGPRRSGTNWLVRVLNCHIPNIWAEPFTLSGPRAWCGEGVGANKEAGAILNKHGQPRVLCDGHYAPGELAKILDDLCAAVTILDIDARFEEAQQMKDHALFKSPMPQPFNGMKVISHPYYQAYRRRWPGCKIVFIERSLLGVVMAHNRLGRWGGWWDTNYIEGRRDPAVDEYLEQFCASNCPDEKSKNLYHLAICRWLSCDVQRSLLPTDALHVNYGELMAEWDAIWPKIFEHCGIEPPFDMGEAGPNPTRRRLQRNAEDCDYTIPEVHKAVDAVFDYVEGFPPPNEFYTARDTLIEGE